VCKKIDSRIYGFGRELVWEKAPMIIKRYNSESDGRRAVALVLVQMKKNTELKLTANYSYSESHISRAGWDKNKIL